ncbi:MAG TPA: cytochrome c3 family protein [Gemmatimonadaceae bacterium]|nr:cytochrome c3 family protein [Gemmatimonadaceae bacterium]
MTALFSPRSTWVARGVLIAALLVAAVVPALAMTWVRTPWARGEHRRIAQPVAFDHRIHVTGLRIDCRYCHAEADRGAWAGLPSTRQCVPCHTKLWMSSDVMAPVRRSLATGRPIPWARVTQLPDFVYFDHAMHVTKGVGCETCHGRVDRMATAEQVAPLTMTWCVDCHRDPAPRLRPPQAITAMGWTRPAGDDSSGRVLAARYHVRRLTNCTTCHR